MKKVKLVFLLSAVILASCSKDSIEDQSVAPDQNQNSKLLDANTEVAFPNKKGEVMDVYYAGQKMPVMSTNSEYIYQGDILLPPAEVSKNPVKMVYDKDAELPEKRSVGRTSGYWPDNIVYYEIDNSLPDQARVLDAIRHWEANTNINFKEHSGESNYIYFTPGSGCSSYIGMIGGEQDLTLADACSTGNVIHEIGHALGLWHEQSRVDRDKYITIHFNNIESGKEYNFQTYEESGFDGQELTTSLDFGSIMMYSPYSFSSNGQPTITKVDGSLYNAQRDGLSSGDIQGINSMYPPAGTQPNYFNGEYYTIMGLKVLRYYDAWWYYTKYGWMEVRFKDSYWYFT